MPAAATDTIPTFEIARHETDRGLTAYSGRNGELSTTAVLPKGGPLDVSWSAFSDLAVRYGRDYQPAARKAALLSAARAAGGPIPMLNLEMESAIGERRAIAAARVRLLTPPPGREARHVQMHAERTRTMKSGERHAFAATVDLDTAAALLDAGPMLSGFGAEPDAWSTLERRAMALFHAEKVGLAADHAQRPTLENPFPVGPDREAVEAAAAEAVAQLEGREAALDDRRTHFQSMIALLAIMLEMQPSAVLDEILSV